MADKRKASRKQHGSTTNIRVDPKLLKALAHPMRIQIVAELNKPGRLLSPRQFSDQFDHPLSNASYHFRSCTRWDAS